MPGSHELGTIIIIIKKQNRTHVSSFFASNGGAGPLDCPSGSKVEPKKIF